MFYSTILRERSCVCKLLFYVLLYLIGEVSQAVENCAVFVICMSEKYQDSNVNRTGNASFCRSTVLFNTCSHEVNSVLEVFGKTLNLLPTLHLNSTHVTPIRFAFTYVIFK